MNGEGWSEIPHCGKSIAESANRGSLAKPLEISGERCPPYRVTVILHEEGITLSVMSGSPPLVLAQRQTQIVTNWNRAWTISAVVAKSDSSVLES